MSHGAPDVGRMAAVTKGTAPFEAEPAVPTDPGPRVSTLRGAGVDVDVRRVGRVVVGLLVIGLAVSVVVLFVAAAHRNQQIDELHSRGVPVEVTVSGCMGLLGGSGSNAAGYQCSGTYTLGKHRYTEAIPGDTFHRVGAKIASIAVPGDPALLTTARAAAGERSSAKVYILPSSLAVVLVVGMAALIVVPRRRRAPSSTAVPPVPPVPPVSA